jgi:ketosteroid isomerase-like protein
MSEENVEQVRRWIRLSNAGDFDAIYNEILDPAIVCITAEEDLHSTPFRGRDEYIRRARDERSSFDEFEIEVAECMDLGEYVVCVARIHVRGRISQAGAVGDEAWLTRWRDGRCVEYRECRTKERALEAAGLAD